MPADNPQENERWVYRYAAGCDEECCADRIILSVSGSRILTQRIGHLTGRRLDAVMMTLNILLDDYRLDETTAARIKVKSGFSKFVTRIECTEVKDG